ncbi:MAG: ribosomal protein S18-alanine N-acetyltransferase [Sneathiellales bacterium]|nr:ribosomal protein S18-alanine N-acetyltransferase [Sneathiellales bacterium]
MTLESAFFYQAEISTVLTELHKKCFKAAWSNQEFNALFQSPGTVAQILSEKELPIGFCLYRLLFDEAEILTLGILPDFRNRSAGETLLRQGKPELVKKGVERLFLDVSETNLAAIKLYKKTGFQEISRRKNYYREENKRSDALIMQLQL